MALLIKILDVGKSSRALVGDYMRISFILARGANDKATRSH